MFLSSMVVFVHIALGGVVGLDIRRSICLKDLLFGALLSILVSFYTITKFFFLSSVERRNLYDTHLMHTLVNLILLENLLMNRSAMAYWRQISCRLINNWPALRSPKVAANPNKTARGNHLSNENTAELGKNSLIDEQKTKPTDSMSISSPTDVDVDDNNDSMLENTTREEKFFLHQCRCNLAKESNSGIFRQDDSICPTNSRDIGQYKNRENTTQPAITLPKIIVVQPIQDPS